MFLYKHKMGGRKYTHNLTAWGPTASCAFILLTSAHLVFVSFLIECGGVRCGGGGGGSYLADPGLYFEKPNSENSESQLRVTSIKRPKAFHSCENKGEDPLLPPLKVFLIRTIFVFVCLLPIKLLCAECLQKQRPSAHRNCADLRSMPTDRYCSDSEIQVENFRKHIFHFLKMFLQKHLLFNLFSYLF